MTQSGCSDFDGPYGGVDITIFTYSDSKHDIDENMNLNIL